MYCDCGWNIYLKITFFWKYVHAFQNCQPLQNHWMFTKKANVFLPRNNKLVNKSNMIEITFVDTLSDIFLYLNDLSQ